MRTALFWLVLVVGVGVAHAYWFRALAHLSDAGRPQFWRILLWSKLFTRRDAFTPMGWHYRTRAIVVLVALLAFVVLAAAAGWIP